ncbi:MAG: GNAT family N-acetyltransferase [Clostridia bacterium]|nr:GNAT family N-acetyltransferase [Clostridia bacterium]
MENREITLREINTKNIEAVLDLKPTEEQKNFVASNMFSLAEAYAVNASGRYAKPLAIYADDEAVGFMMIGYDYRNDYDGEEDERPYYAEKSYLFWRFMVDAAHQGKGYGRTALALALDFIRTFPAGEAAYCWLSYDPKNEVARKLYASSGFEEKKLPEGWDEIPSVLKL